LGAARAKALAAQDRTPLLWFERNGVGLPALVANDLKAFAIVTAAAALLRSTEAGATFVAARLAALGVTQTPLAVIILFSISKWERISTLGASDFQIRH
jgi:hypothetical protein